MLFSGTTIVAKYDPRGMTAEILVGILDKPGLEESQLSLNHKLPASDDGVKGYPSATAFVADQSDAEIKRWIDLLGLQKQPGQVFQNKTIVVEDASIDTCLSLIMLAKRVAGEEVPRDWVRYAGLWEAGYVDHPVSQSSSLGALLSALAHVDLQTDKNSPIEAKSMAFTAALTKSVTYIWELIEAQYSPFQIPRTLFEASETLRKLHQQALSRLEYERMAYARLKASAPKLQLAVQLTDTNRKTLVDAILFRETVLTSSMKYFSRTDPNTFTGQGFSIQALYRPEMEGTGNDITISTNPTSGIHLFELWYELEKMEEEKWQIFADTPDGFPRPRGKGNDRLLNSHKRTKGEILPCHQPWWDEKGDLTLVAAPRFIEHGGKRDLGSRLSWSDVKHAIWKCYAPTMGLRVRAQGTDGPSLKLTDDTDAVRDLRKPLNYESGIKIVDIERADGNQDDAFVWSPTLASAVASLVVHGATCIDNLIPTSEYDVIEDRGDFIIVTENGIALLNLSVEGTFPTEKIRSVAAAIALTVANATGLTSNIRNRIRSLVEEAVEIGSSKAKREALRAIYSAKLKARTDWDTTERIETDYLVQTVQRSCESRWKAKERYDAALQELEALEAMVVSSSEVRANTMLNRLAIYALPASLAGDAISGMILFDKTNGHYGFFSYYYALAYAAFAGIGIMLLKMASAKENRLWTPRKPDR